MNDDDVGARKKARVSQTSHLAPLAPLSFSKEKCQQLHADFAAAEPFPHLAVSDLCDDGFLRSVRAQIISELKADYKETDIFKVLQTGTHTRSCISQKALPRRLG